MSSTPPNRPRRVCLISLGCPKNLVDSETMLGSLPPDRYRPVTRMEEADIVVVNTCGFLRIARREGRAVIRRAEEWRRRRRGILVVAGCLVQYYGGRAGKIFPGADLILGVGEGADLGRILEGPHPAEDRLPRIRLRPVPAFSWAGNPPRLISTPRHWAYLRISDGCDNRCSYCLIPSLRGPNRERPLPGVLEEARRLAGDGARELVLIAQDTARYGKARPGRGGLAELLEKLSDIAGIGWIRILYAHPRHIDDSVLQAVAGLEKVCPYLDIPVQHIDDGILRRMGRKIDFRRIRAVLDRARELVPGISLRTTLMVGFPGEGEDEFGRLAGFVRRERFDHLGVFTYSREKGTPACQFGPGVPGAVARRRRDILMGIQREISAAGLRARQGRTVEVLLDVPGPDAGLMVGHSAFQAPEVDGVTVVEGKDLAAGEMVKVRITGSSDYDLRGVGIGGRGPRSGEIIPVHLPPHDQVFLELGAGSNIISNDFPEENRL